MVAPIKRPKKTDPQASGCFFANKAGVSLNFLPFLTFRVEASVINPDIPVVFPGIGGADIAQIPFERMVESCAANARSWAYSVSRASLASDVLLTKAPILRWIAGKFARSDMSAVRPSTH